MTLVGEYSEQVSIQTLIGEGCSVTRLHLSLHTEKTHGDNTATAAAATAAAATAAAATAAAAADDDDDDENDDGGGGYDDTQYSRWLRNPHPQ